VNTEKNTWYCGKCEIGGDVIDFYAASVHDLAPSDFHRDKRFPEIIREMAEDLGIQIVSTPDGAPVVEASTEQWASNQLDTDEPNLAPTDHVASRRANPRRSDNPKPDPRNRT
jgi:hypothetical protein